MEVEHGLPRLRAARIDQVHAVGAELLAHPLRPSPGRSCAHRREVVRVDLQQVLGVLARDDEQVAGRPGLMSMNAIVRSSS